MKVQVLHSKGCEREALRKAIQDHEDTQASATGNSELVWQYEGNTCWQVFDRESSREMMQQAVDKHQHSWTHTYSKCEGNWEGVGNLTDSFGANPPRQKAVPPKGNLIAPIPPKSSGSDLSHHTPRDSIPTRLPSQPEYFCHKAKKNKESRYQINFDRMTQYNESPRSQTTRALRLVNITPIPSTTEQQGVLVPTRIHA